MSVLLFLCIVTLMGAVASKYAKLKGRDTTLWFWLGMLFGLMALIVLYFLSDAEKSVLEVPLEEEVPGIWYTLDHKHEPVGPLSFSDIRSQFKEGTLTGNSYLWQEEWSEWKLASEVVELREST